jgi:hypothetical protein
MTTSRKTAACPIGSPRRKWWLLTFTVRTRCATRSIAALGLCGGRILEPTAKAAFGARLGVGRAGQRIEILAEQLVELVIIKPGCVAIGRSNFFGAFDLGRSLVA